jgi:hypothetical protein
MKKFSNKNSQEERLFGEIIDLPPEKRKSLIESVRAYEFFLANQDLVFSDKEDND